MILFDFETIGNQIAGVLSSYSSHYHDVCHKHGYSYPLFRRGVQRDYYT